MPPQTLVANNLSNKEVETTSRGASVEFRALSKNYGSFEALRSFDLSIRSGEFLTLLGPSGSGKTTTLMLLAGFEFPSSGQVLIGDQDVSRVPSWRRDQGIVFQSYSLFPHMTIGQNLAFPLETRGLQKHEVAEKTKEALQMVRLDSFADRYPSQLSGGQQQRVALARALVADPPLLLMDEPLGALDKNLREEMQIEIKHIQQRMRLTVLYVTHDQEEALTMSDRIVVMNEGQIQQIGVPEELYERPRTRFVAEFFGDVNILPGRISGGRFEAADNAFGLPVQALEGEACGALRPEKIAIQEGAEGGRKMPGWAVVPGEVIDVIYLGQMCRYVVRSGGTDYIVKTMAGPGVARHAKGGTVTLSWDAADFVLLQ
ncbi:polyamine-transporting ATPase [Sulfitobacter porphyrae]|nr:polyamine-transporting ATPase [Sulfitobacter porphyrae]